MAEKKGQPAQKPGFLDDHKGDPSSMRLMSVTALLASIAFGLIVILHSEASRSENGLYITIAFLIAAFAPKALQKFAEAKFDSESEDTSGS
jgi:hypothetical protein